MADITVAHFYLIFSTLFTLRYHGLEKKTGLSFITYAILSTTVIFTCLLLSIS